MTQGESVFLKSETYLTNKWSEVFSAEKMSTYKYFLNTILSTT